MDLKIFFHRYRYWFYLFLTICALVDFITTMIGINYFNLYERNAELSLYVDNLPISFFYLVGIPIIIIVFVEFLFYKNKSNINKSELINQIIQWLAIAPQQLDIIRHDLEQLFYLFLIIAFIFLGLRQLIAFINNFFLIIHVG